MSILVEASTGAQILPRRPDERARVETWAAQQCCDADLRTKSDVYRALASTLEVRS